MIKMLEEDALKKVLEEWEDRQEYVRSKIRYEVELDHWKLTKVLNGIKSFVLTVSLGLAMWAVYEFAQWFAIIYTLQQRTNMFVVLIGIMIFIIIWAITWSNLNPPKPADFRRGDRALNTYLTDIHKRDE